MDLSGVVDLHVHSAPDVRQRSIDDLQLAREALRLGVRAVVIKSHYFPTAERAWLVRQAVAPASIFGGITLNPAVGGINPHAVEVAIRLGAKIVWLPTLFSAHHRRWEGKNDGVEVVAEGKVVAPLVEVLEIVAAHQLILATGHLAPEEIFVVVDEAKRRGVQKILINHPEHAVVGLSFAQQMQLARRGVYFERCYAQPLGGGKYQRNLRTNLEAIRAVGHESTVLASDGGQVENPFWSTVWKEYLSYLRDHGVAQAAIDRMVRLSPAELLGL